MNGILNQIIVQKPTSTSSHLRITVFQNSMIVERGQTYDGFALPFLATGEKEILPFDENPELRELYQDYAWNIPALAAFVTVFTTIIPKSEPVADAVTA